MFSDGVMYLLDTMVLSELRKSRRDTGVLGWLGGVGPQNLYLSVVTVGEIERGIERQQSDRPDFAAQLSDWLDTVLGLFDDRILPVDMRIARRWGRLSGKMGNANADLLIAATALEHNFSVVTRNLAHFKPTGVRVLNPYSD